MKVSFNPSVHIDTRFPETSLKNLCERFNDLFSELKSINSEKRTLLPENNNLIRENEKEIEAFRELELKGKTDVDKLRRKTQTLQKESLDKAVEIQQLQQEVEIYKEKIPNMRLKISEIQDEMNLMNVEWNRDKPTKKNQFEQDKLQLLDVEIEQMQRRCDENTKKLEKLEQDLQGKRKKRDYLLEQLIKQENMMEEITMNRFKFDDDGRNLLINHRKMLKDFRENQKLIKEYQKILDKLSEKLDSKLQRISVLLSNNQKLVKRAGQLEEMNLLCKFKEEENEKMKNENEKIKKKIESTTQINFENSINPQHSKKFSSPQSSHLFKLNSRANSEAISTGQIEKLSTTTQKKAYDYNLVTRTVNYQKDYIDNLNQTILEKDKEYSNLLKEKNLLREKTKDLKSIQQNEIKETEKINDTLQKLENQLAIFQKKYDEVFTKEKGISKSFSPYSPIRKKSSKNQITNSEEDNKNINSKEFDIKNTPTKFFSETDENKDFRQSLQYSSPISSPTKFTEFKNSPN